MGKKFSVLALVVVVVTAVLCITHNGNAGMSLNMLLQNQKGEQHTVANRIAVFTTNKGTFEVELFEDKAPITTKNFIDLAEKGFYDGLIFHRVIDGFMIQGEIRTGMARVVRATPFQMSLTRHSVTMMRVSSPWQMRGQIRAEVSSSSRSLRRRGWTIIMPFSER